MAGIAFRTEKPEIPCPRDRRLILPHIGKVILGPRIAFPLSCRIEDQVDFRNLETREVDVEADGNVKPKHSIERAIALICFLEWVRALRG